MDIKEFATLLNGRQYRDEITTEEEQKLKELGFVVVFGASDDLVEFRGAIYGETDYYDGKTVFLDNDGIIENCEDQCKYYRKALTEAKKIDAVWCEEGYSWVYKTEIPHATFDIFEDDEKYCRGIVFDIKDLGR